MGEKRCRTIRAICLMLLVMTLSAAAAVTASAAQPKLNKTKVFVSAGSKKKLKVKNRDGRKVKWHSLDRSIVRVSKKGVVRGVAGGSAFVTAAVGTDPQTVLTCLVKVRSMSFREKKVTMRVGNKQALALDTTNISGKIKWKSSNKSVATVSKRGVVKAKKKGTVKITASYKDCKAVCKVKVRKAKTMNTETEAAAAGTSSSAAEKSRWDKLLEKYLTDEKTNELLFVKYTGGSKAEVELYEKKAGAWEMTLSCSGEVGRDGIDKKREGDMKTPTGVFALTSGYGIADDPGAKLPYVKVNRYLYWCGDRPWYNQLIDIREHPHNCHGEHLIEYTQCYEYGMFLDFNKKNVFGKGAAIFLHVKGNKGYTAGCIAVSRGNMKKLLRQIGPGGKICIYPK